MIHSRDAAEDTLEIVKEYMKKDMSGGSFTAFPTVRRLRRNI